MTVKILGVINDFENQISSKPEYRTWLTKSILTFLHILIIEEDFKPNSTPWLGFYFL